MGITGLNFGLAKLEMKFAEIEGTVKAEIAAIGSSVQRDASINASGIGFFDDRGSWVELNGKIQGGAFDDGKGYKIWVNSGAMGAYIEFGTGEYASQTVGGYEQNWRDLAYTFYVNGKGKLPARPYMYPAFVKNTTGLRDRLINKLRRI